MTEDPKVRRDGRCARPGCRKPRPVTVLTGKKLRELRRYAGGQIDADPFCSSRCCRAFHGVALKGGDDPELSDKQSEALRLAKQQYAERRKAAISV